jgi:hypothetical protein
MRWLILGNVCDQPPPFDRIGNRSVGSRIVQAGSYHDRPHHPVLHRPVARHARQLDAKCTGMLLDLGCSRH